MWEGRVDFKRLTVYITFHRVSVMKGAPCHHRLQASQRETFHPVEWLLVQ